jgi:hypothetical protein
MKGVRRRRTASCAAQWLHGGPDNAYALRNSTSLKFQSCRRQFSGPPFLQHLSILWIAINFLASDIRSQGFHLFIFSTGTFRKSSVSTEKSASATPTEASSAVNKQVPLRNLFTLDILWCSAIAPPEIAAASEPRVIQRAARLVDHACEVTCLIHRSTDFPRELRPPRIDAHGPCAAAMFSVFIHGD